MRFILNRMLQMLNMVPTVGSTWGEESLPGPHPVIKDIVTFALEDTVDLDVFNPPRQDWIDRDDAYLRSETAPK